MEIQHITVRNFGSVRYYDAALNSGLNILDIRFTTEIAMAVGLVLCNKSPLHFQEACVEEATFIAAEVLLDGNLYFVERKPFAGNTKKLSITVTDANGKDRTRFYVRAMSHCAEQDDIDHFDGQDNSSPMRLCRYKGDDDCDAPGDLLDRTNFVVGTKIFRSHLMRYIKTFAPEPINNKKKYQVSVNEQGKFEVMLPGVSGEIRLSETEEKLFRYICFLNVAEFWEGMENIRDMHHTKKPLLIRNFLEFLDESTDTDGLMARTVQLGRQVILFTLPMKDTIKRKKDGRT